MNMNLNLEYTRTMVLMFLMLSVIKSELTNSYIYMEKLSTKRFFFC